MKKKLTKKDLTAETIRLIVFGIKFIIKLAYEQGYRECMKDVIATDKRKSIKLHNHRTNLDMLTMIFALFALGGCIMTGIIFYMAYSHPEKAVLVLIDRYGEADIEAVIVIPLFLIGAASGAVLSLYRLFSNTKKGVVG